MIRSAKRNEIFFPQCMHSTVRMRFFAHKIFNQKRLAHAQFSSVLPPGSKAYFSTVSIISRVSAFRPHI